MAATTVLIADDLKTFLKIEKTFMTRAGFEVLTAENGERAVELAYDKHPRLILLDLEMPEMDGAAACAAMRRDPGLAYTPILAVDEVDLLDRHFERPLAARAARRRPVERLVRRQFFSSQGLRPMGFSREACCPSCWASPIRIPSGPRM